jgi:threonyl-tRNA synthetase
MSTVQYDFGQPAGFGLEYQAADGTRQQPVMIHSAKFGSIERFFGVLTEHYAGAFPVWLAPVQAVGIPVADEYADYLGDIVDRLRRAGVRAELDTSDDRMQKKIRTHTQQKVPFQLIAGENDRAGQTVSFRFRDGSQENGVAIDDAIARIRSAIDDRRQVTTRDDLFG